MEKWKKLQKVFIRTGYNSVLCGIVTVRHRDGTISIAGLQCVDNAGNLKKELPRGNDGGYIFPRLNPSTFKTSLEEALKEKK